MTFGTLDFVREILERRDPNTNEVDTRDDPTILRVQSTVHQALLRRLLQCNPAGPPTPFAILDPITPTGALTFDRLMADGFRRLRIVIDKSSGTFVGGESVDITGIVGGSTQTDTIDIDRDGAFMTRLNFDSIALTATVVPNAALITAIGTGTIEVLENIGVLTDIENYWTGGMFLMEKAKLLAKQNEPPEMHPWIKSSMKMFEEFLKEFCLTEEPGQFQGQDNLLYRRGTSGDVYGDLHTGVREFFP